MVDRDAGTPSMPENRWESEKRLDELREQVQILRAISRFRAAAHPDRRNDDEAFVRWAQQDALTNEHESSTKYLIPVLESRRATIVKLMLLDQKERESIRDRYLVEQDDAKARDRAVKAEVRANPQDFEAAFVLPRHKRSDAQQALLVRYLSYGDLIKRTLAEIRSQSERMATQRKMVRAVIVVGIALAVVTVVAVLVTRGVR